MNKVKAQSVSSTPINTKDIKKQKHLLLPQKWSYLLLSILLFTVTASFYFSSSPIQAATKEVKNQRGFFSWANILDIFKRKRSTGGSRGPGFCAIAPFKEQPLMKVWSLQPVFVWKGIVPKINVNSDDGKNLFSKDVNGVDRILYQGEALQPGKTYKLEIFGPHSKSKSIFSIPFQIMAAPEREELAAKLKDLEARLKAQKANKEMIALHRAQFFADRELWVDVLQSALSVEHPSSDALKKFIQELPNICQNSNT